MIIAFIKRKLEERRRKADELNNKLEFVAETLNENREFCIICGADTGVGRIVNIKDRPYYIAGGGQLCQYCWDEIYRQNDRIRISGQWEAE